MSDRFISRRDSSADSLSCRFQVFDDQAPEGRIIKNIKPIFESSRRNIFSKFEEYNASEGGSLMDNNKNKTEEKEVPLQKQSKNIKLSTESNVYESIVESILLDSSTDEAHDSF
jgi:hypothetical protein